MPCSPRVMSTASHAARARKSRAASRASSSVRMRRCVAIFGFVVIRRDERRAGVAGEMRDLRIDDQRRASAFSATSASDDRPCDDALQVIRYEQTPSRQRRPVVMRAIDLPLDRAIDVGVALVVDARHLLIALGDDPHLFGRRARAVFDEAVRRRRPSPPAARAAARRPRRAPTTPTSDTAPPSAAMLCATLAAPPRRTCSALEMHDRHRRLRRNARHAADDEPIDHHVAGDEHGQAGKARDEIARAPRVERLEASWCWRASRASRCVRPRTAA